jgi:tyrosine-protein phosphatase YwqE
MSLIDLFKTKKSYIKSGLLYGITDIHCHLLPGVDDGISAYEEAVKALHWLKDKGIRRMYLTPHVMSDLQKNTRAYLTKQFEAFTKRLEEEGVKDIPELKLGSEYMLEAAFEEHKKDGLITYADRQVLVETSYMLPPAGFIRLLEKLMEDGYSPALAHPERYLYMEDRDYKYLKNLNVSFQLNFLSLTGAYGQQAKEKAAKLLKSGYYNYAGSDFHHLKRHENNFSVKALTKEQRLAVKELFENNNRLW